MEGQEIYQRLLHKTNKTNSRLYKTQQIINEDSNWDFNSSLLTPFNHFHPK